MDDIWTVDAGGPLAKLLEALGVDALLDALLILLMPSITGLAGR